MIAIEVENRSGVDGDEAGAADLARRVLAAEGIEDGELGIAFVDRDGMRALKRDHLGVDEPTDVLSFPIDGRDPVPEGVPRAWCSARRSSATSGAGRSRTACCTCSATSTARR